MLSQRDQVLLLCAFAIQGASGEVLAECLRQLATAPTSVVKQLAEAQLGGTDEIALLGLIDLLITYRDRAVFGPMLLTFLRETATLDVYRYGVTARVAARREDLIRKSARWPTQRRIRNEWQRWVKPCVSKRRTGLSISRRPGQGAPTPAPGS